MALDPGMGHRVTATIVGVKGTCTAGHHIGESFEISCQNPAGLCGFFFHDIFPSLQTLQFGGKMPWWDGDTVLLECPDRENLVTLKLQKFERR